MRHLLAVAVLALCFGYALAEGNEAERESPPENQEQAPEPQEQQKPVDAAERVWNALHWLADHQHREGYWCARDFREHTKRPETAIATGNLDFVRVEDLSGDAGWDDLSTRVGVTGLALQAFASAGFAHREGEFRQTCRNGVLFFRRVQKSSGLIGELDEDHAIYGHAMATIAMAEIFRLTNDMILLPLLDRAAGFIMQAQNPGLGWRYGVQPGVNDTSVTGMMMRALNTIQRVDSRLEVGESIGGAFEWFDLVTLSIEGGYRTGYDSPGSNNARLRSAVSYDPNATMEAIHGWCRLTFNRAETAEERAMVESFQRRVANPADKPQWRVNGVDFYYWLWATDFMLLAGGDDWTTWHDDVRKTLFEHQRGWHPGDIANDRTNAETLQDHGSWDPVGAWGEAGGRVYATAMAVLILNAEQRQAKE